MRYENDLTDEELLAMWERATPVEVFNLFLKMWVFDYSQNQPASTPGTGNRNYHWRYEDV